MDGLFGIDWDLNGEVDITDDIITLNLLEKDDNEEKKISNKGAIFNE
ncbi:hypothetical protein [Pseudobutyrivibrio ruminis]|nr:hypothetical protein [Pseudobutyrivibrio ruminis]